ncbi:hypothetical protein DFH11DRAFT_1468369, partial [Phellopilus nigrolimitatus]
IARRWEGWEDDRANETVQRLAKITKRYGGADLRALCVEAALNTLQRQFGKSSTSKLLI